MGKGPCFECKLKAIPFLYALQENFVKIDFQNSVKRLSFLCRVLGIKIAWINPWNDSKNLQPSIEFVKSLFRNSLKIPKKKAILP